jgi:hypothetical protein
MMIQAQVAAIWVPRSSSETHTPGGAYSSIEAATVLHLRNAAERTTA